MRTSFVLALTFASIVFGCQNTYAEESNISMEVGSLPEIILTPGEFNSTSQTFSVETNNQNGYNVTLETVGNATDLRSTKNNGTSIPTITLPVGAESIRSSAFGFEYGYSMDGINFKPVPNALGSGDILSTTNTANTNSPHSYTLTYGVKAPNDLLSGTYTRTFIITASVNGSYTCEEDHICYNGNGNDSQSGNSYSLNAISNEANHKKAVAMEDQLIEDSTEVTLLAPKYRRKGYGFAGWNTKSNGAGTNYGPNQTISASEVPKDGLTLFANWIKSSGTLQEWNGCEKMTIGDTVALTDERDNNTYVVAKMPDQECWMTENLRLNLSDDSISITTENTNNPTTKFATAANDHPSPTSSFCTSDSSSCMDKIQFNNTQTTGPDDETTYSYGNYYNWYTATAGNGLRATTETSEVVAGDICPKGWHLPTGYGEAGNLVKLDLALGGSGKNQKGSNISKLWHASPLNLVYSGEYNGSSTTNIGVSSNYHTSTANNNARSNNLWFSPSASGINSNGTLKNRGQTIRCIAINSYTIKFDKNIDAEVSGTMRSQIITRTVEEKLSANAFSVKDDDSARYQFMGWNTKADGSGTNYADAASVKDLAKAGETITLYAQWKKYPFVNITTSFVGGGVSRVKFVSEAHGTQEVTSDGQTIKLVSGETYSLSMHLVHGYTFVNWVTSSGEIGSTINTYTTFVPNKDATLIVTTVPREGDLYLQDVIPASCTDIATTAYDVRDGEEYTIKRLNDGNCWMLDNLRLGSTETITLTSADTNLNSADASFTLPGHSDQINSYVSPQINTSKAHTSASSVGEGFGETGVYYNYCAASAGTVCSNNAQIDSTADICPAGWRLPNGNSSTGEFIGLSKAYKNKHGDAISALSLDLSGYFDSNYKTITNLNSNGYLWSSTKYNANKSYMLQIRQNWLGYTGGGLRSNGLSIRCVLKQ